MAIQLASKEKKTSNKKSSANKSSLAFLILSIIFTVLVWFCALSNLTTFLIIFPLLIIFLFIVIIPSLCTIFIIWSSEGFRKFVSDFVSLIGNIGDKTPEILQTIFPYIAALTGVFAITAFVLNLIFYIKKKEINGLKPKFITSCIFMGLAIIAIIIGAILIYK